MGFGVSWLNGHNPQDDELFGEGANSPANIEKRKGYLGDSEHISAAGVNEKAPEDWSSDGGGQEIVNGYRQQGTSAYDKDVAGYRQKGEDAQKRAAVTLDQRRADQARGFQMGGLGLMRTAAEGNAPSRAAELGTAATDGTARSALAGMAGARGPGAAVAGANAAGTAAAGTMAKNNAAVTDLRAAEMAKNQSEFAQGAGTVRGQDIGAATQNAQYQAHQNALNEAKQEGYENLGYDTRLFQGQTSVDAEKLKRAQDLAAQQQRDRYNQNERDSLNQDISTTASIGMMAASDERAKRNVHPIEMGSLGGLHRFMHGR